MWVSSNLLLLAIVTVLLLPISQSYLTYAEKESVKIVKGNVIHVVRFVEKVVTVAVGIISSHARGRIVAKRCATVAFTRLEKIQ